eukprot:scaffold712_cov69-Cyclotella_meneghiniana.AAC.1
MEQNQDSKPPPKKGVFKGKRSKPKFTRNARTGAQKKSGVTLPRYRDALRAARAAPAAANAPSPSRRAVASITSRAAMSSPTKKEFKAALRRYTNKLRAARALNVSHQMKHEAQQKKNSSLKRKLEEKEETIKAATRQNSLHKAALKKAEKAKARVETALHREMAFRTEDAQIAQAAASAAEAAFDKERRDFQAAFKLQQQEFDLLLKEAVSEAKVCILLIMHYV